MGDRAGFVWKQPPANNFIDELVAKKLQRTKTLSSDLCSDAEFLRRIHLDLTGLPPTVDDVRLFLAEARDSKAKRDELIAGCGILWRNSRSNSRWEMIAAPGARR